MPRDRSQVSFTCLSCGDLVSAPLKHVGLRIECPSCRAPLAVPAQGAPGAGAAGAARDSGEDPVTLLADDGSAPAETVGDAAAVPPWRRFSLWWLVLAASLALLLLLLVFLIVAPRGREATGPAAEAPGDRVAEAPQRPGTRGDAATRDAPGEPSDPGGGLPQEPGMVGARDDPEQEDTLPDPPTEDEKAAWRQAVQAVLWKLKDPDSAEFPEPGAEGTSIERREGRYIVNGYVDAKNRLGETVRTEFRSVVEQLPGADEWVTRTVRLTED